MMRSYCISLESQKTYMNFETYWYLLSMVE